MGRINDTVKYPLDSSISLNEILIGSDDDGKTKNYRVSALVRLIESGTGFSFNYSYRYTDTLQEVIDEEGKFTTDFSSGLIFSNVTRVHVNKINLEGNDLTDYLNILISNPENVVLKIHDGTPDNFAYYKVFNPKITDGVYSFYTELIGTVGNGEPTIDSDYMFSFDIIDNAVKNIKENLISVTLTDLGATDFEDSIPTKIKVYAEAQNIEKESNTIHTWKVSNTDGSENHIFIIDNKLFTNYTEVLNTDIKLLTKEVDPITPAIATPPLSGTFFVDLSNYLGTDYSATSTTLTNFDISAGAVQAGFARIKGTWASEPTVTGATHAVDESDFVVEEQRYLYFEKWANVIIYWFSKY